MISKRMYEPVGIIMATNEGLLSLDPGGEPRTIVADTTFLDVEYRDGLGIAASAEGVWVHNGRRNERWQNSLEQDVAAVAVTTAGTLFAGTTEGKLFSSDSSGESWREIEGVQHIIRHGRFSPPAGEKPRPVSVAQAKEGILIGISGGGTWHTRDNGDSWLRRADGLDPKVHKIYSHPTRADRLFATASSGVYRSEDEGYSWIQSLGGLDRSFGGSLAVLPGAPDSLVLSMARHSPGTSGAVFRSANGGVSWSRLILEGEDEWEEIPCVTRPSDWEDLVFIAAGGMIFASHDRGRNWLKLNDGLPICNAIAASL